MNNYCRTNQPLKSKKNAFAAKDAEIASLQAEVVRSGARRSRITDPPGVQAKYRDAGVRSMLDTELSVHYTRHGKVPPIDSFRGNDPDVRLDNSLPTLEREALWNDWSDDDKLVQLAGHLRGKAAREYTLISPSEKQIAVQALQAHLESGRCALADQDFRNAIQREKESVPDYISRLECSFQVAYGHESLTAETRDTSLFGQLQAGLKLILMESPAVSDSLSYKQLCTAAKQEEKQLLELKWWRQHQERKVRNLDQRYLPDIQSAAQSDKSGNTMNSPTNKPSWDCYVCGKNDHLTRECKLRRGESTSSGTDKKTDSRKSTVTRTNAITSVNTNLGDLLYSSDSDDGSVNTVHIKDKGNQSTT